MENDLHITLAPSGQEPSAKTGTKRRLLLFLAIWGGAGLLWTQVFPQLAASKPVTERIARFEAQGIDPAAIYYTDHPRMMNWLRHHPASSQPR